MNRIKRIMEHPLFIECIEKNKMAEVNRRFCHHDISHLFAVANRMYLGCLEKKLGYHKDVVYAIGLLHDIGRFVEYETGTSHDIASVSFARPILEACDFNEDEITEISNAILGHRGTGKQKDENDLSTLLYIADKSSRLCSLCDMYESCNWSEEKKRMHITWIEE